MTYKNFSSNVLKVPDKKLLKVLHDAAVEAEFEVQRIEIKVVHLSETINCNLKDMVAVRPLNGIIQDNKSSLVELVVMRFATPSATVTYRNEATSKPVEVEFNFQEVGDDPSEEWRLKISRYVAKVRIGLGATSGAEGVEHLLRATKAHYKVRDEELLRMETIADGFFDRLQEHTTKRDEEFEAKCVGLDDRLISRGKELENQHKELVTAQGVEYSERLDVLKVEEARLKDWADKLDALNNTDARRKARVEIKRELKERDQVFRLTRGTNSKRRPVHLLMIILLFGSAVSFFWFLSYAADLGSVLDSSAKVATGASEGDIIQHPESVWERVWVFGRVVFSALVFFTSLIFYIRWNIDWFERHASEEFRHKRLVIDMDRATWLSEMALEWRGVTSRDMPEGMLEALGKNLFVLDGEDSKVTKSAADVIASALFGEAFKTRFKVGETEVELDRKGAGKIGKTEVESSGG